MHNNTSLVVPLLLTKITSKLFNAKTTSPLQRLAPALVMIVGLAALTAADTEPMQAQLEVHNVCSRAKDLCRVLMWLPTPSRHSSTFLERV